jgi:ribosomal protein L12E/L44/L45/RPP1/RPP2
MQYLAAYALASLSGKNAPSKNYIILAEADLNKILSATGEKFSQDEVKKVVANLKGKKIEDV